MIARSWIKRWTIGLTALAAAGWMAADGQEPAVPARPHKVTIKDEKAVIVEVALPVDPTPRIRLQPQGLVPQVTDEKGRTLHLSHFPTLSIDGQIFQNGGFGGFGNNQPGGKFEKMNQPLGKSASGRARHGFTSVFLHGNDLRITSLCEIVPTKAQGKATKRRSDSVLCRFLVENRGKKSHKFGMRIYMDVYVISNDGAQFAVPNQPGKILNGVVLKDKMLPDYVQLLERPNLQDPGFVAHLTLNLGNSLEKPDRVVLTQHGVGFGTWDMPAQRAFDTALGVFWEPKEIRAGGKREFAYGYGQGICLPPEGEGQYEVKLSGSFQPGKLFTVTAVVGDPSPGQSLTLEMPAGMEAVEGRSLRPVPPPPPEGANSLVMWKGRVTRAGTFPLRVRSSTGTTITKMVTVEKGE